MTDQTDISNLPALVRGTILDAVGTPDRYQPDEQADIAGLLHQIERAVSDRRRDFLKAASEEALASGSPFPAGRLYGICDEGSNGRDYDDAALLELIGGDPVNGLVTGLREGLFSLSWNYTPLVQFCRSQGLPLIEVKDGVDVGVGDRARHIVTSWKPRPTTKPVPPAE